MTRAWTLGLSMSGPAIDDAVRGLAGLSLIPEAETLKLDHRKAKVTADWLEAALEGSAKNLLAQADDGHSLVWERGSLLLLSVPGLTTSPDEVRTQVSSLPFELAVIGQLYVEWYDATYRQVSFGDGHVPHGFSSAVKGNGVSRLVSPRWLDHGPWLQVHVGDATWLQFHALSSSPTEALAQAQPGWARLGISDEGGFIQSGFVFTEDVGGVWDPTTKTLKVMVPRGAVTPRKMLEIAAARGDARVQDGEVERTAFIFLDEANARAHLDELWCYGHEVWAIVDGDERRLDQGHEVAPVVPGWATS
jgi:hypothetical protein